MCRVVLEYFIYFLLKLIKNSKNKFILFGNLKYLY